MRVDNSTSPMAMESAAAAQDIMAQIHANGIRNVRLVLTDLYGVPRGKLVSVERFERALTEGHPFAIPLLACNLWEEHAPSERTFSEDIGYRNGVLYCDPKTFAALPWTTATAHILTDLCDDADEIMPTPRAVLRRVIEDARSLGLEPMFGNELEFYVFRPDDPGGFAPIVGPQSWFSVHALGMAHEFVDRLEGTVTKMGLGVYEIFAEHGAGQFEINFEPGTDVLAIDRAVATKMAIKEVAQSLGLRATFMAKPTNRVDTPPSGYHLHQTLMNPEGKNLFQDEGEPDELSALARHYIAGQLLHARAMTGAVAGSVTAYKRYQVGTWAPVQVAWGVENRTALVRGLPAGRNTRIENRLGGADANPYILAAVMVAAGIDGIRRRLDPGPPTASNLFKEITFPRLPANPAEGLDAFLSDDELVQALGSTFSTTYAEMLRFDWERFLRHVTDWEISEYREML
jgi:glutamine synthetase